jgi:hypothetical protein
LPFGRPAGNCREDGSVNGLGSWRSRRPQSVWRQFWSGPKRFGATGRHEHLGRQRHRDADGALVCLMQKHGVFAPEQVVRATSGELRLTRLARGMRVNSLAWQPPMRPQGFVGGLGEQVVGGAPRRPVLFRHARFHIPLPGPWPLARHHLWLLRSHTAIHPSRTGDACRSGVVHEGVTSRDCPIC